MTQAIQEAAAALAREARALVGRGTDTKGGLKDAISR